MADRAPAGQDQLTNSSMKGYTFDILTGFKKPIPKKVKPKSYSSPMGLAKTGLGFIAAPSYVLESARSTVSAQEYRESMEKHARSKLEPRDKFTNPVTTAQELGWEPKEPTAPLFGRTSCQETKIAEGQILGARHT